MVKKYIFSVAFLFNVLYGAEQPDTVSFASLGLLQVLKASTPANEFKLLQNEVTQTGCAVRVVAQNSFDASRQEYDPVDKNFLYGKRYELNCCDVERIPLVMLGGSSYFTELNPNTLARFIVGKEFSNQFSFSCNDGKPMFAKGQGKFTVGSVAEFFTKQGDQLVAYQLTKPLHEMSTQLCVGALRVIQAPEVEQQSWCSIQ